MTLIATDKIAAYIDGHSESRIPLLTWLKEYPYHLQHRASLNSGNRAFGKIESVVSFPGIGEFAIKYQLSYFSKIAFVTWVGRKEELTEQHSGIISKTVKVITPKVSSIDNSFKVNQKLEPLKEDYSLPVIFQLRKQLIKDNVWSIQQCITTMEEYKLALKEIEIFLAAKPNTPEFEKLFDLLPLVKDYEINRLEFPLLTPLEIVNDRNNILKIDHPYLSSVVGDKIDFENFIFGNSMLSVEALDRLYKVLSLNFPASDQRFF